VFNFFKGNSKLQYNYLNKQKVSEFFLIKRLLESISNVIKILLSCTS